MVTPVSKAETVCDTRTGMVLFSSPARQRRARIVLTGLSVLLVLCAVAAIGIGMVPMTPGQVSAILARRVGLDLPWGFEGRQEAVLYAVRLPRVVLGGLIGAGLAVSGAAMQGLFRNPLADPGLIGVSSGAALAAVAVIVLGATLLRGLSEVLGPFTLPCAAFQGGLIATLAVHRLASVGGRTMVATMLLAGIAVNALAGAGTGFLTFMATDAQLRNITFWSLGSLGGTTWTAVSAVAPCMLTGLLLLPWLARSLNVFLLGEAEAGHLGIQIERLKRRVIVLVALAVGAAVSTAGIIGFIGVVVPHVVRLLLGPDHRYVLPGSALLGASLLIGADVVARTVVAPAELPLGIVTAVLGAPCFLRLLLRQRRQWSL
jgi:iron complex transport system permease protein